MKTKTANKISALPEHTRKLLDRYKQEEGGRRLVREIKSQIPPAYKAFQKKYFNNRVGFVQRCIKWKEGERPTDYQLETFQWYDDGAKDVAIRGPHGIGKSTEMALLLLHFALTRDGEDWKAPTTASVWRQLTKFLWPEIHKWARRIKWDKVGRPPFDERNELLQLSLRLKTGEAFAIASNDPTAMEGAHADHLFFFYDESKAIPDAIFDATEGATMGGGEIFRAMFSTPGEPQGRFYHVHARKPGFESWKVRHVTLADAIAAGRITIEKAEQLKRQWGEGSAVYQNRVLGEFAASDEDGVIPLAWVEAANERWREWVGANFPNLQTDHELMAVADQAEGNYTALGVDVGLGGEGSDNTVLAPIKDRHRVTRLRRHPRSDPDTATMETAGRVKGFLSANIIAEAFIDIIGIGAGVVHRLKEQVVKSRVHGFNAAQAARLPSGQRMKDSTDELTFSNKRSAMWWKSREMLSPDSLVEVALPPDDKLTGDLTAPKYKVLSGGVIHVEKKEEIIKRIKRSTDDGDATLSGLTGPELAKSPDTELYIAGAQEMAEDLAEVQQHMESDEGEYYIVGGGSGRNW